MKPSLSNKRISLLLLLSISLTSICSSSSIMAVTTEAMEQAALAAKQAELIAQFDLENPKLLACIIKKLDDAIIKTKGAFANFFDDLKSTYAEQLVKLRATLTHKRKEVEGPLGIVAQRTPSPNDYSRLHKIVSDIFKQLDVICQILERYAPNKRPADSSVFCFGNALKAEKEKLKNYVTQIAIPEIRAITAAHKHEDLKTAATGVIKQLEDLASADSSSSTSTQLKVMYRYNSKQ